MTNATSITVRVPLAIRHRSGRKTVVTPMTDVVAPVTTRADPALVKALARAFRYQRMLDQGRYASTTEMAEAERIERGYLGTLLRLTLLAPDIVQAILDGRASSTIGLPAVIELILEVWLKQREHLAPGYAIPVQQCPLRAHLGPRAAGRTSPESRSSLSSAHLRLIRPAVLSDSRRIS